MEKIKNMQEEEKYVEKSIICSDDAVLSSGRSDELWKCQLCTEGVEERQYISGQSIAKDYNREL